MVLVAVISIPFIIGYLVSNPLFCISLANTKEADKKNKDTMKNMVSICFNLLNFINRVPPWRDEGEEENGILFAI